MWYEIAYYVYVRLCIHACRVQCIEYVNIRKGLHFRGPINNVLWATDFTMPLMYTAFK